MALMTPIRRLKSTPTPTMKRPRPLARPSSRTSQAPLARGQRKPTTTPRTMTSTVPARPDEDPPPPPPPPPIRASSASPPGDDEDRRPPPPPPADVVDVSIHASSIRRNPSGDGSVSGVYRDAWIDRNCSRSWFTSAGVKPAPSRRSKPRRAGVVVVVAAAAAAAAAAVDVGVGVAVVVVDEDGRRWCCVEKAGKGRVEVEVEVEEGGAAAAAAASAASSAGVRPSPMLQFT